MIQLKGVTWANPRGYFPLKATSASYQQLFPEIEITWEVRSLKDFGDYPIELLAQKYDLIILDHPHVGISSKNGYLVKLDEWVPKEYLDDQARHSVGKSHESYWWEGHQWALANDAAAQVAVYRADLLKS